MGQADPELVFLDMWAAVDGHCDPDLDQLRDWARRLIQARRTQLAAITVDGKLPTMPIERAFAEIETHRIQTLLDFNDCCPHTGDMTPVEDWIGGLSLNISRELMKTGCGWLFYVTNWPHFYTEEEFSAFGRKRLRSIVAAKEAEAAEIIGPILTAHGLGFGYKPREEMYVSGVEMVIPLNQ